MRLNTKKSLDYASGHSRIVLMSIARAQNLSDLSVYEACGLLALIKSRDVRRPVSPTKVMTIHILEALRVRGVVEVPWPAERWQLPPRGYLAPIEQLSWDFVWPAMPLEGLQPHLEDFLREHSCAESSRDELIVLWRSLIRGECIEYFEYQLSKHHLDPAWSDDLGCLPPHYLDDLSLLQWKYLIWSAVRHGTMVFMRFRNMQHTRNEVARELASPRRFGIARGGTFEGFFPRSLRPYSLMGNCMLDFASQLESRYWSEPPNEHALLSSARALATSDPDE